MSVNQGSYAGYAEISPEAPAPDGAEAGDGGGVMSIWTTGRVEKVSELTTTTFSDNSTFGVPKAVVNVNGYSQWDQNEAFMGVGARGIVLDSDGLPLTGTASMELNGEVEGESAVNGSISVNAPPDDGVLSGTDSGLGTYNFRFTPSSPGIDVFKEDVGSFYSVGTVQYGSVEGTVTDFNGDPVEGDSVSGPGASTPTDAQGNYSLLAPGGTTVTLNALSGSASVDRTPNGGQTLTVDFQYGGLEVVVQIPDGTGLKGVLCAANEFPQAGRTGQDGTILFERAPVSGNLSVDISEGKFSPSTTSPNQGQKASITKDLGFGVKGLCVDEQREAVIAPDVRVTGDTPLVAEANPDGTYVIGDDQTGEVTVSMCVTDRRFSRTDKTLTVQQGDVKSGEDFVLEERENIGTSI